MSAEPDDDDPEESLIGKAKKTMDDSQVLQHLIRYLVMAAIGAGSAVATRQVGDAHHDEKVESNYASLQQVQEELDWFKAGFRQRVQLEEEARVRETENLRARIVELESQICRLRGVRTCQ